MSKLGRFACLTVCFLIGFILTLSTIGCVENSNPSKVPNTIPAVGTSLQKTGAYVESAKNLTVAAQPESNDTGKKLLAVAVDQQTKALDTIKEANKQVQVAESERVQVEKKYSATAEELAKVKRGWGYRLQVFVAAAFWIVVALLAFHYIGGIAGLFIAGPVGAFISTAAAFVNPAAWFQTVRDNIYFRRQAKAK